MYVREGPGTQFKAIGYLKMNDTVEALEANSDGSWLRVRRLTDDLTGWSSRTYLEKISTAPPPPPPTAEKYRVTASRLHVREGSGTNFKSLGFVEFNEVVTAVAVNPDGTWRQIRRSDGLTGWSSARYLVLVPVAPPAEQPPTGDNAGTWYRATGTLYLREGPGTTFRSSGYLSKDEAVEALTANEDQSWIQFRRVDGSSAWASSAYLTSLGRNPASIMQKVFGGVTYYRTERTRSASHDLSRPAGGHARASALRFLVTPPLRDSVPQLCTRKTSQFLDDHDMQIAINGDGYYYLKPSEYPPQNYCPDGGDPVRLAGYAASRGAAYSAREPGRPILYINQRNQITFDQPKGKVYNAISGDRTLLVKGKKFPGLDAQQLHPRTALGVNQNSRWMYLVVIDGRETSEGATLSELADILISHGAYSAINFDGGGSSTMVIEGADGKPRVPQHAGQ